MSDLRSVMASLAADVEVEADATAAEIQEDARNVLIDLLAQGAEINIDIPIEHDSSSAASQLYIDTGRRTYRYVVTVEAPTKEQADQVMAERLGHDDDLLDFDYVIPQWAEYHDGSWHPLYDEVPSHADIDHWNGT